MKAWILIDTTENTGSSSIKGVFLSEGASKIFMADYLMEKQPDNYDYIELFCVDINADEVEEMENDL